MGLDPVCIRCDAWELERGILSVRHAGTHDDNEPLRGFHLACALPFDQWLSNERTRLARLLEGAITHGDGAPVQRMVDTSEVHRRTAHNSEASVLCVRGHCLFMRSANGGSPQELLHCHTYFDRALAIDPHCGLALAEQVRSRLRGGGG